MLARRLLVIGAGAALGAGSVVFGCAESDPHALTSSSGGGSGQPVPPADAGGSVVDAVTPVRDGGDSGAPADAAPDAAAEGGADGGDGGDDAGAGTITTALAVTGVVRISSGEIAAHFYEDDTVVRASNAPECAIHLRSATKPPSPAGTLTIGGTIVGTDGGAAAPIVLDPAALVNTYAFAGPVFPTGVGALVAQVALTGPPVFPSFAAVPLHTPRLPLIAVTKPAAPDAGTALVVSSASPLAIEWTVPAGDVADQQIVFALEGIAGGLKTASIHCRYPVAQAKATVPANVLAEVKSRVGLEAVGRLHVLVGEQREVGTAGPSSGSSYVIEVTRLDTTTFGEVDARLQ